MRITSSSRMTACRMADQVRRVSVAPTVRCTGKPARSLARSASRQVRRMRRSTKQNGRPGSTGRAASSYQFRLARSRWRWAARSRAQLRWSMRAAFSTCTRVHLEGDRNRANRNRWRPWSAASWFLMSHDHGPRIIARSMVRQSAAAPAALSRASGSSTRRRILICCTSSSSSPSTTARSRPKKRAGMGRSASSPSRVPSRS